MAIDNLDQINDMHMDVLKELGNIGAGNAVTALATMMEKKVDMTTPAVKILEINDAADCLGGPENVVVGILGMLEGDVDGLMVFMIEQEFALSVINHLLSNQTETCTHLSEMELSAVGEIGNIMISSYISAISALSGLTITTTVPAVNVDMVGALLSAPAIIMEDFSDRIIFIENDFLNTESKITANVLMMPSIESLNKIMTGLGIVV